MRVGKKSAIVWILPLAVMALAMLIIATDAGGLASYVRTVQRDVYQTLQGHIVSTAPSAMARVPLARNLAKDADGWLALTAIVTLVMTLLFARARFVWGVLLGVVAIIAAQGLSWSQFDTGHMMLDSFNPSLVLLLGVLTALLARGGEIARTRGCLRQIFADGLPPAVLSAIARKPSLLQTDGHTREITCLVCRVRDYDRLADSFAYDAPGFARIMSAVITPLIETAIANGALVDCVTGSGFTAYWNAPLDTDAPAMQACEATNRMLEVLAQANEQFSRERRFDGTAYDAIDVGIGIASGPAVVGNFGTDKHLSYCVSGSCTELAARICALSGQYGPAVVATESTRRLTDRNFAFLEVDCLAVGPRGEPVKLYAMLGNPLVRASPKFRALATFHDHIFQSVRNQKWDKARALTEQCRKLSGASQKLYDLYLARIAFYERNPPGAEWDGAFRPPVK